MPVRRCSLGIPPLFPPVEDVTLLDRPAPAPLRAASRWPALPTRAYQLLAWLLAWLLAGAVATWSMLHYLHTGSQLADLHIYRSALLDATHGRSVYAYHSDRGAGFTYPPFAALLLAPLAHMAEPAAQVLWTGLTVAAVAGLAFVVARMAPPPARALLWPLLTALALASKPVQSNLRFGQVSILLALVVTADALALDGRRGQGVLTGLAAAVKLTPLIFIPYLWLTGRRRAAVLAGATAGVATLAAWVVLPADSRAFWAHRLLHDTSGLPLAEQGNQSISAVALRAGGHGGVLAALWLVLGAAVGVACLWRGRLAWQQGKPLVSLAIVGCGGILVSPISWLHTQVWILLAAVGVALAATPSALALAVILGVPMLVGLPGVAALGPPGRWLAANHRAVLALLVACLLPLRRPVPAPLPPGATDVGGRAAELSPSP